MSRTAPRSSSPPTLCVAALASVAPGMIAARWLMRPVVGSTSSVARCTVVCCRTFCRSTTGLSPVTVTVSATSPTGSSALTVAVKPLVSSRPSRRTVLKPGSVKVTV